MKTQITASVFWRLFQGAQGKTPGIPEIEHFRHRCLLGFTALDAAIYTYWEASVLPEWDETMSLVSSVLDSPSSQELLTELSAIGAPHLKKSQLVATLRFISNTGEASRFTPNFIDFAAYLLLRRPEGVDYPALVQQLSELQTVRNSAIHTGRPWSEIQAHRSLKLIEETAESLSVLGKNFAEAFSKESSRDMGTKTGRAA